MTKAILVIAILFVAQATTLYLLGQPLICACGYITLFVVDVWSSQMSQQLTDWYSFSHIIHGFIFYALLWLVARRLPVHLRLAIAVALEAASGSAVNSQWVIG